MFSLLRLSCVYFKRFTLRDDGEDRFNGICMLLERFSNDCRKPKPKQLFRAMTTGTNSTMNQSQFLLIICNSLKAREKPRVHGAIGFGLTSHWLKNWRESF